MKVVFYGNADPGLRSMFLNVYVTGISTQSADYIINLFTFYN